MKASFFLVTLALGVTLYGCRVKGDAMDQGSNPSWVTNMSDKYNNKLTDSIRFYLAKNTVTHSVYSHDDSLISVIIDTLLYSPKRNKLAALIIFKHSNVNSLIKSNKTKFQYSAECFISSIEGSHLVDLRMLSAYSLSSYPSQETASARIREIYFTEFNKVDGALYKYNLGDAGFWDDPHIWLENQ